MRRLFYQFALILPIITLSSCMGIQFASSDQAKFVARIPSARDEANNIWNQLKNIHFYYDNGYNPSFPNDGMINSLIDKSYNGKLSDTDYDYLLAAFGSRIYKEEDYSNGYKIVHDRIGFGNSVIPVFEHLKSKWGFFIPNQYTIMLTLYGTGGSYDPKKGMIFLKTTREGHFARSSNPLNTVIHEAVHIGIENIIAKRFDLSQWTKERIVDQLMVHYFLDLCPDYEMQPNRETAIDRIFNDPNVWDNLPRAIEQYLQSNEDISI